MRILLLTGYDDHFSPLGSMTVPLMEGYAQRHGLDFWCQRQYPKHYPAYWQKLVDIVQAFEDGYDQVIWLDADQMVTNPSFIPAFRRGFQVSEDWGKDVSHPSHFSMCGFSATRDTKHMFEWCLAHEDEFAHGDFPDQKPMRQLYDENQEHIHINAPRVFNAVPIEVHESVRNPWHPGDWCAHLTMVSIERRVELFHKINDRLAEL